MRTYYKVTEVTSVFFYTNNETDIFCTHFMLQLCLACTEKCSVSRLHKSSTKLKKKK